MNRRRLRIFAATVVTTLALAACGDSDSPAGNPAADGGAGVGCGAFDGFDLDAYLGQTLSPTDEGPSDPHVIGDTACTLEGDTTLAMLQIWDGGGADAYAAYEGGDDLQSVTGLGDKAAVKATRAYVLAGDNMFAITLASGANQPDVDKTTQLARVVLGNLGW